MSFRSRLVAQVGQMSDITSDVLRVLIDKNLNLQRSGGRHRPPGQNLACACRGDIARTFGIKLSAPSSVVFRTTLVLFFGADTVRWDLWYLRQARTIKPLRLLSFYSRTLFLVA